MRRDVILYSALAVLGAIAVITYVIMYLPRDYTPTPEEAARIALEGETEKERAEAAVALARSGEDVLPLIRETFDKSDKPEVRAALAQGMGNMRDVDSLGRLIDALDDPALQVRVRAGVAVVNIVGIDYNYDPRDEGSRRAAAIRKYEQFWAEVQKPGNKWMQYQKNPELADQEAEQFLKNNPGETKP